jgi:hypothetical protein
MEKNGGSEQTPPFIVKALSLGTATRSNIQGMFTGSRDPKSHHRHGFHIAGIISHTFFSPYALTFDFEKTQLLLKTGQ